GRRRHRRRPGRSRRGIFPPPRRLGLRHPRRPGTAGRSLATRLAVAANVLPGPVQPPARLVDARPGRRDVPHRRPRRGLPPTIRGTLRVAYASVGQRHQRPPENDRWIVDTDAGSLNASVVISATGTWQSPYLPYFPGQDTFTGRQLHTVDYDSPDMFAGRRVV